jgi:hypothetical protein
MSGADNNRRINVMARTIRTKIYKFDELSKDAQQKAVEWYLDGEDFSWIIDDASETLDKFCEIFDISYRNFDYCETYRSSYSFNLDDNILELSGQRLATYIWNNYRSQIYKGKYYGKLVKTHKDGTPIEVSKQHPNGTRHVKRYSKCQLSDECVLTGVCYDYSVLQPIYNFLKKPSPNTDFKDLLEDCLNSLAEDVCSEIDGNKEFSAVADTIQANDYEFTKDGKRFI